MKIFLLISSCWVLSGCASITELTSRNAIEARKNNEILEQQQIERAARNLKIQNELLVEGKELSLIKNELGEPSETEFHSGRKFLFYNDEDVPLILEFKNDRLVSNKINRALIEKNENEIKEIRAQKVAKEKERKERIAEAIDGWGKNNRQKVRTDCNPNYYGGVTCISK